MKPTPANLHRMRLLSAKGIRTVKIPLMPKAKYFPPDADLSSLMTPDIEYEEIRVDDWLERHDPLWRNVQ